MTFLGQNYTKIMVVFSLPKVLSHLKQFLALHSIVQERGGGGDGCLGKFYETILCTWECRSPIHSKNSQVKRWEINHTAQLCQIIDQQIDIKVYQTYWLYLDMVKPR